MSDGSPDVLLSLSRDLTRISDQLSQVAAAEVQSWKQRLAAAIDKTAYWVSRGVPEFDAMLRASRDTGFDYGELKRSWAAHRKHRKAVELHTRRRLVMLLTERGWSDKAIASTVGCHPDHVSRIRREMRGSKIK